MSLLPKKSGASGSRSDLRSSSPGADTGTGPVSLFDRLNTAFRSSWISCLQPGSGVSSPGVVRTALSEQTEHSMLLRAFTRVFRTLAGLRMHVYGWFLLSFGFYALAVYLLKRFGTDLSISNEQLYFSISLILLSIPCLISRLTLTEALMQKKQTRFLLIEQLGIREAAILSCTRTGRSNLAFLIGMLAGAATYYVQPYLIVSALLLPVLLSAIFLLPECGLLVSAVLLPFGMSFYTVTALLTTFFSYIWKCIRGKRTFRLELQDPFVLLFLLCALAGGILTAGRAFSLPDLVTLVCYIGIYFLISNLSGRLPYLIALIKALYITVSAFSLYTALSELFRLLSDRFPLNPYFCALAESGFPQRIRPELLTVLLVFCIPMSIAFLRFARSRNRFRYFLNTLLLMITFLLITTPYAWIALLAAMLTAAFLSNWKKTLLALLSLAVLLFVFQAAFPDLAQSAIGFFKNCFAGQRNAEIQNTPARLFSSPALWLGGIGAGQNAGAEFGLFSGRPESALSSAPSQLWEQILLGLGIVGLVLLVLNLILSFLSLSDSLQKRKRDSLNTPRLSEALISALTGLTVFAFQSPLFALPEMCLFFFFLCGICASLRRIHALRPVSAGGTPESATAELNVR